MEGEGGGGGALPFPFPSPPVAPLRFLKRIPLCLSPYVAWVVKDRRNILQVS